MTKFKHTVVDWHTEKSKGLWVQGKGREEAKGVLSLSGYQRQVGEERIIGGTYVQFTTNKLSYVSDVEKMSRS